MIAEAAGLMLFPCLFPCLVIGIIMLISLLTCDFIEKFVMERFCSVKNRRRRQRESSSGGNSEVRGKPSRERLQDEQQFEANNAARIQGEMPTGPHSSTYNPLPGPSRTLDIDSDDPPPYHECISNNKSKKQ